MGEMSEWILHGRSAPTIKPLISFWRRTAARFWPGSF